VRTRKLASYSEILKNESVEEMGVCIPQVTQVDVFLDGSGFRCQLFETWKLSANLESESEQIRKSTRTSLGLELVGFDIGRSKTVSSELSSHFNGIGSIGMYSVPFDTVNTQ
jgi:hypothetical protein